MYYRLLTYTHALFLITACGGGGGSEARSPMGPSPTGAASSPKNLSLNSENAISADTLFNYFEYFAETGERLVVRVNLSRPLSDIESTRCAANLGTGINPSSYATQVHVYDSRRMRIDGICGEDLVVAFPESGKYTFSFDFPSNGGGKAYAASIKGSESIHFSDAGDGSPSKPKRLSTAIGNAIPSNPFNNYFWIQAEQGDNLLLSVQLSYPLSQLQKTRCASGVEAANNAHLRVFDAALIQVAAACGETLTFVAPTAGTYVFKTDYGINGGTLNVARL